MRLYGQLVFHTLARQCLQSWERQPRESCKVSTWGWAEDAELWLEEFWSITSVSKNCIGRFIYWSSGFTELPALNLFMLKVLLCFKEWYTLYKSWNHRTAQAGRDLRRSPVQAPDQSKVSTQFRPGCLRLCPFSVTDWLNMLCLDIFSSVWANLQPDL